MENSTTTFSSGNLFYPLCFIVICMRREKIKIIMNWKILIKNIFGGLTFHTHFPRIDNCCRVEIILQMKSNKYLSVTGIV